MTEDTLDAEAMEVTLDGTELALLVSATWCLADWPFEQTRACELRASLRDASIQHLYDQVSQQARSAFEAAGLRRDGSEAAAKRLSMTLHLDAADLSLACLALRTSAVEFSDHWWEFWMVFGDGVNRYGVEPADLEALAVRLEGCAANGLPSHRGER